MRGIVVRYLDERGFGFLKPLEIEDNQTEVFFHARSVAGRYILDEGDHVEFDVKNSEKGLVAINVKKLKTDDADIKNATSGVIVGINPQRTMGTIRADNPSIYIFFYFSYFVKSTDEAKIDVGERVTFKVGRNSKGFAAFDIKLVEG